MTDRLGNWKTVESDPIATGRWRRICGAHSRGVWFSAFWMTTCFAIGVEWFRSSEGYAVAAYFGPVALMAGQVRAGGDHD